MTPLTQGSYDKNFYCNNIFKGLSEIFWTKLLHCVETGWSGVTCRMPHRRSLEARQSKVRSCTGNHENTRDNLGVTVNVHIHMVNEIIWQQVTWGSGLKSRHWLPTCCRCMCIITPETQTLQTPQTLPSLPVHLCKQNSKANPTTKTQRNPLQH